MFNRRFELLSSGKESEEQRKTVCSMYEDTWEGLILFIQNMSTRGGQCLKY